MRKGIKYWYPHRKRFEEWLISKGYSSYKEITTTVGNVINLLNDRGIYTLVDSETVKDILKSTYRKRSTVYNKLNRYNLYCEFLQENGLTVNKLSVLYLWRGDLNEKNSK